MAEVFDKKYENPHFEGVFDIDPQDLLEKINQVKIVDVREVDEYTGELGHIDGAELVVLNTIPERLNDLPKDKPVVFICKVGGRSSQAAAFAKSKGFDNVYNMRGGMMLWNRLNLPITKEK